MLNSAPFQIYNASAGSGKTFTLVKKYLSILLSTSNIDTFKQVLAITFTNKAVNEMKERVLNNLYEFSQESILTKPTPLFSIISEELAISEEELNARSKKILTRILHNYAFFDIVTIDKFNHRLLRTFAFDLKLPTNFEVSLDEKTLTHEAVDNLIYQAGNNKLLTDVLIDFALEKTDDDKSWDISRELNEIAKLLSNEEYIHHIEALESKNLEDFKALGKQLKELIAELETAITSKAKNVIEKLHSNQLDASSFNRGTLYNHFIKIIENNIARLYENKLEENLINNSQLYTKTTNDSIKSTIDEIRPFLLENYLEIKNHFGQLNFLKNFYKNLVPLSLLNAINAELNKIKEERNLLLISEFNRLISSAIANQPAPFIYERIGEKYKHYFIDEFQDTSSMQWKNIQPLISNALEAELPSGKTGSLMIVGDAKQAIYRWRGGKAEQFIDLYNKKNPFQAEINVENLPKNFRSHDKIVEFNNNFFQHISQYLNNETYRELFEKYSKQETNNKAGGFINLTFINEKENKESEDNLYCTATQNAISSSLEKGFTYNDMCIITRSKAQGITIANYLAEQEIPIISSETLLLKNDKKVAFLIDLITYFNQPLDAEIHLKILRFLAEKNKVENLHEYYSKKLSDINSVFEEENFNTKYFLQLPFYNAVEYAINAFEISNGNEAYLQFFLDEIISFTQNNNDSLSNFLAYWEQKQDSLSIVAPSSSNAIQLMTIHKSKGLEFPVVIYPFANTSIYDSRNFNLWFPVDKNLFGIDYSLFNSKSAIENINDTGKLFVKEYEEKEELDNLNLLYVTLTRAVEQLHIICKREINTKGEENVKTFAGLFINFLKAEGLWNDNNTEYTLGDPEKHSEVKKKHLSTSEDIPFISNASFGNSFELITKSGSLWDTKQQRAIDKGNIYHHLLSKIFFSHDVIPTIEEAIGNGLIPETEKEQFENYLTNLTQHPMLEAYFTSAYKIFNEREIITADGVFLRPDRFVVKNNEVTIIDYKTGSFSETYKNQIKGYASAISEIGCEVKEKLLVFVNENIEIIQV